VVMYEGYVRLAEKLNQATPGDFAKKTMFVNSGAEAVENAVKIARRATGRPAVLAFDPGFHGRTLLALTLTSKTTPYRDGFGPFAPEVYRFPVPDPLRRPRELSEEAFVARGIADLRRFLASSVNPASLACAVLEPVMGEGGFIVPPRAFVREVTRLCREHGIVLVADEVQTGFGRTGDKWWGIEHWGVEPELMTMAKGIANGLPLSACVATPAVADSLKALTISTFGGNPLSVAAANATLEVIERDRLRENAATNGGRLREGLERLQKRYPRTIGDVRGMGLMQGVEFVKDETSQDRTPNPQALSRLFEETKKRGLLIGKGGLHGNIARISPPMIVNESEVAEAVKILDEGLAAMGAN